MTRLLLVGAGHGHLHVLTRAGPLREAGYDVAVLAPRWFDYSGTASAVAAGEVARDVGRIDVAALAARAEVRWHEGMLTGLDRATRVASTSAGAEIGYDVLSLNIGSVVSSDGIAVDPAVLTAKPLAGLHHLPELLAGPAAPGGHRITVVGAGATGLELACHLSHVAGVAAVRILEAGNVLGADLPRRARRRMRRELEARGVTVRLGCAVRQLSPTATICADGREVAHDAVLLATGLRAPPLIAELGLGTAAGIPVTDTLRHPVHADIYAVGDCADFVSSPLPKIGVHGVRQGPVLVEGLLARARQVPPPAYRPPRRTLSILDLGGGKALATWGPLSWYGGLSTRLKRRIDHRWLSIYTSDPEGPGR